MPTNLYKISFLFLSFFFLTLSNFAQTGYYRTDSTSTVGVKIIDGGDVMNAQYCQVKNGNQVLQFNPHEIIEYGFKNGKTYISKDIVINGTKKRVFLEQLVIGESNLYYYQAKGIKTFFLEKDSTIFIELSKGEKSNNNYYKKTLQHFTKDCENVLEATKLSSYKKNSLTKVIERYNNCELKPFPSFRYGVFAGFELSAFKSHSNIQQSLIRQFDFPYDGSFTIGTFIDAPIMVSNYSFHLELYYSKHGCSINKQIDNNDVDFVANISTIKMPVLLRYTFPFYKIRPFVNIGGIGAYHFKNESMFFEAEFSDDIIQIYDKREGSIISDFNAGVAGGLGLELPLDYKHSLFFELRYNNLFDAEGTNKLRSSEICFTAGINF